MTINMKVETKKIYKIITFESSRIDTVTDELNKRLGEYSHWETRLKFDINAITGYYYFVLTVLK